MPAQYYFDELDPVGFQRLINTLLVKRYGEGVRLLPIRGKDGGRDVETPIGSSYFGVTVPKTNSDPMAVRAGRYLFQVKHHRMLDRAGSSARATVIQDFQRELADNVIKREGDDTVDYFFLITNVPSTKETFDRVDLRREELRAKRPSLHAEILWQDHVVAWLDQNPSTWAAFPEVFAGRVVPTLGQIAAQPGPGLPLSLRLAISEQMRRDSIIKFRQVNLEQRLARLFVDLNVESNYDNAQFPPAGFLESDVLEAELAQVQFGMFVPSTASIPLLTSESTRSLSKIILEGGPGQGKSTVTQMLAQIYRSTLVSPDSEYRQYSAFLKRARLPIRVELRLFAEWFAGTSRSVEQYLAQTFSNDAGGAFISVDDIHNAVRGQDVLLIFDGLDEVGSDALRDEVVSKLLECISRFESIGGADVRVIVTSRPPAIAGRLGTLKGFRRLQLQALDDRKVTEYITRWTEVQCSDVADRERVLSSFVKRKSEDHVAALVKNPMQLSVLLHFIRLKGEAFPDKRAELYREYFKTVIDRDVEKSQDLRRNRDDVETLHEVIGFTIHSRAEGAKAASRLTRPDLIRLVRRWFETEGRNPDLGESLFEIGEERLGLIVALSGMGESTQYGFEIQPVREYFAAAFINDKCEANAHDLFEQMMLRPFWREVARFLAGLRRANERADLLSRARQLDHDAERGWRSNGVGIILQLLQEGVLTTPGHVHRDALAFVIDSVDAENCRVRVEPPTHSLHRLIAACDSGQPRDTLNGLLQKSRKWNDHHDLRRLWSICNRVLPESQLYDEVLAFEGDDRLFAEMAIRWPIEAGKSLLPKLAGCGRLDSIPERIKNEHLFFAAASDAASRATLNASERHQALLEEFVFQGVFGVEPIDAADTPFAVWKLCESLLHAGISMQRNTDGNPGSDSGHVEFCGLQTGTADFVKELIDSLRLVAIAGNSKPGKAALQDLLHRIIDVAKSGDFDGLLALRCATTLLGCVEGPQRPVRFSDGGIKWGHFGSSGGMGLRSALWQWFRRELIPFFAAALPQTTDRIGRTLAARITGMGYFRMLPSHISVEGELVTLLNLLIKYRAGRGGPDWADRMPVQQYWLRTHVDRQNVRDTLDVLVSSRLEWSRPVIPLRQPQIRWIADTVRGSADRRYGLEVLFALQGSNFWSKFGGTLGLVLSNVTRSSSEGASTLNLIPSFWHTVPMQSGVVAGAISVARSIMAGEIRTTSAIAANAALFMSQMEAEKLPPLRELEFLPQTARRWYEA